MTTTRRLTRKAIKEDEVLTGFNRGVHFLTEHSRETLYLVVGAVAIAVAAGGIWLYHRSQNEKAAALLGKVLAAIDASVMATPASPVPGLQAPEITFATQDEKDKKVAAYIKELKEDFGSSSSAAAVTFYEANGKAEKKDLEGARTQFEEFARRHPESVLAPIATSNAIKILRQQGKGKEALARLNAMLTTDDKPLPSDLLLFELAQTYEVQGSVKEAAATYEKLAADFPDSPYAAVAGQKQQSLGTP